MLVWQLGRHAEGGFVQANDWLFSGTGFDRQHVEAATGGIDAARTKELAGHAGEVAALVGVDGVFGGGVGLVEERVFTSTKARARPS